MGTVLFRRNTGVFQGKNRSQRRETVRFGLMGFDSLLLYDTVRDFQRCYDRLCMGRIYLGKL